MDYTGELERLLEQVEHADLDYWSSDAAHWAVSAYAGTVWHSNVESGKQLEFWMWWLKEAIPAAWRIVYGTDRVIGQR